MSNELKTIQGGDITPAAMLKAAIDRGTDISQLGSLMELYEKFERKHALTEFNKAILEFKRNPPEIFKTKLVDFVSKRTGERTSYKHALLENIVDIVTPALCDHGLIARWEYGQTEDNQITVTCILSHVEGHSVSHTLKGPAENSGTKNSLQAIGSTTKYLERYTLLALLGLTAKGVDDDGQSALTKHSESNLITDEQVLKIESFIAEHELPMEPVMQYLKSKGHGTFAELPAKSFEQFMATLRRSAAAKEKAK